MKQNSNGKLKPCPFCEARLVLKGNDIQKYYSHPLEPDCYLKHTVFLVQDLERIECWNTRFTIPLQEWISVKEKPPKEDVEVLVYNPSESDEEKMYTDYYGYHLGDLDEDGCKNYRFNGAVTHWMPLPSTPKKGINEMSSR